jgi:diguanylate cyclase (GGDEF)-like protein
MIDRSLKPARTLAAKIEALVLFVGVSSLLLAGALTSRGVNRYIAEIVRHTEAFSSLYAIVDSLSKTIDIRHLQHILVDVLGDMLGASRMDIITHKETGELRCATYYTNSSKVHRQRIAPGTALAAVADQWFTDPSFEPTLSADGNQMYIPISRGGVPFLLAIVREMERKFDPGRLWLIKVVSGHIAVAFENARLYTLAITDELTGLHTRRHFDFCLERKLKQSQIDEDSFALLMFDIDGFKAINDTYGHVAGDTVLRGIGALLMESIRDIDVAFRYGGEEFAVLLPSTEASGALLAAERIRAAIEKASFEDPRIRVTVSIGISSWPEHPTSGVDLVQAADGALYKAKNSGKNRCILADAPVPHV